MKTRAQERLDETQRPPSWVLRDRKFLRCVRCDVLILLAPGAVKAHARSCRDPLGEP